MRVQYKSDIPGGLAGALSHSGDLIGSKCIGFFDPLRLSLAPLQIILKWRKPPKACILQVRSFSESQGVTWLSTMLKGERIRHSSTL